MIPRLAILLFAASLAGAQQAENVGVSAAWDVQAYMTELDNSVRGLEPILGSLTPRDWIAKGASAAYVRQLESSQSSLLSLFDATAKLSREPERLTIAVDAYFQMERIEMLLNSLKEGVRRYQSAEAADKLNIALSQSSVHRDRLRQHIRDLGVVREQEYRIIDQEAQRCRGSILRVQPDVSKVERKRSRKRD